MTTTANLAPSLNPSPKKTLEEKIIDALKKLSKYKIPDDPAQFVTQLQQFFTKELKEIWKELKSLSDKTPEQLLEKIQAKFKGLLKQLKRLLKGVREPLLDTDDDDPNSLSKQTIIAAVIAFCMLRERILVLAIAATKALLHLYRQGGKLHEAPRANDTLDTTLVLLTAAVATGTGEASAKVEQFARSYFTNVINMAAVKTAALETLHEKGGMTKEKANKFFDDLCNKVSKQIDEFLKDHPELVKDNPESLTPESYDKMQQEMLQNEQFSGKNGVIERLVTYIASLTALTPGDSTTRLVAEQACIFALHEKIDAKLTASNPLNPDAEHQTSASASATPTCTPPKD